MTAPLPRDAQPFPPLAIYSRWWAMTEACSGRSGDLTAVHWYRVPGRLLPLKGEWVGGYWSSGGNQIVLADSAIDHGTVVRHEMLHALIRMEGHPRVAFLDACAGVVDCEQHCIMDSDQWHAPLSDYALVPPESLDVDSEAKLLPRETDGQRWVTLQVTVHNPRGRAVMVAEPGEWVLPRTFLVVVLGPTGGVSWEELARDSSRIFFRAHETKSQLFEFRVGSGLTHYQVPPGTVLLRGGYARRLAPYDTVIVAP